MYQACVYGRWVTVSESDAKYMEFHGFLIRKIG